MKKYNNLAQKIWIVLVLILLATDIPLLIQGDMKRVDYILDGFLLIVLALNLAVVIQNKKKKSIWTLIYNIRVNDQAFTIVIKPSISPESYSRLLSITLNIS